MKLHSPARNHPTFGTRAGLLLFFGAWSLCSMGQAGAQQPGPQRPYAVPQKVDAGLRYEARLDPPPLAGPVPKLEPLRAQANRPYRLNGRTYRPMTAFGSFRQRGDASWYGDAFQGRRTATGERFEMHDMSAAHPTLPLPSYVKVTNLKNGASVVVRVNDRGPFVDDRVIDVSYAAARHLGMLQRGTAAVQLDLIVPDADAGVPAQVPEGVD